MPDKPKKPIKPHLRPPTKEGYNMQLTKEELDALMFNDHITRLQHMRDMEAQREWAKTHPGYVPHDPWKENQKPQEHAPVNQGKTIPEAYNDWRGNNLKELSSLLSLRPGQEPTSEQFNALLGMVAGSLKVIPGNASLDPLGRIISTVGDSALSRLAVREDRNLQAAARALKGAESNPTYRAYAARLHELEKDQQREWLKHNSPDNLSSPFVGKALDISQADTNLRRELESMLHNHMKQAVVDDIVQTMVEQETAFNAAQRSKFKVVPENATAQEGKNLQDAANAGLHDEINIGLDALGPQSRFLSSELEFAKRKFAKNPSPDLEAKIADLDSRLQNVYQAWRDQVTRRERFSPPEDEK